MSIAQMLPATRRNFLGSIAAAALLGARPGRAASGAKPKKLIYVFAHGAWDVTAHIDPKESASIETVPGYVKTYGNIPIWSGDERPALDSFFTEWNSMISVIHGINVGTIAHAEGGTRMLTGRKGLDRAPDIGVVVGHVLGSARPIPYLMLGERGSLADLGVDGSRVGNTTQLRTLLSPDYGYPNQEGLEPFVADVDDEAALAGYLDAVTASAAAGAASDTLRTRLDDFALARTRGEMLSAYRWLFEQFPSTMDYPGQIATAVSALSAGLCQSVAIDAMLDFDSHTKGTNQIGMFEKLATGLSTLAELLSTTPGESPGSMLMDETVVAVVSEFTRSTQFNSMDGKDHWPYASVFLLGATDNKGRVYGGTDDNQLPQKVDFATGEIDPNGATVDYAQWVAGLFSSIGVDSEDWVPGKAPYAPYWNG